MKTKKLNALHVLIESAMTLFVAIGASWVVMRWLLPIGATDRTLLTIVCVALLLATPVILLRIRGRLGACSAHADELRFRQSLNLVAVSLCGVLCTLLATGFAYRASLQSAQSSFDRELLQLRDQVQGLERTAAGTAASAAAFAAAPDGGNHLSDFISLVVSGTPIPGFGGVGTIVSKSDGTAPNFTGFVSTQDPELTPPEMVVGDVIARAMQRAAASGRPVVSEALKGEGRVPAGWSAVCIAPVAASGAGDPKASTAVRTYVFIPLILNQLGNAGDSARQRLVTFSIRREGCEHDDCSLYSTDDHVSELRAPRTMSLFPDAFAVSELTIQGVTASWRVNAETNPRFAATVEREYPLLVALLCSGFTAISVCIVRFLGSSRGSVAMIAESTTRELRDIEAKFRVFMESSQDVVSFISVDGTIRFVSSRSERLTGWTQEELRARSFTERIHPEDLNVVLSARSANHAGKPTRIQYRRLCKDGRYLWMDLSATPLKGDDGSVEQIMCVSRDITASHMKEQRDLAALRLTSRLSNVEDVISAAEAVLDAIEAGAECEMSTVRGAKIPRSAVLVFNETGVCSFVSWRGLSDEYRKAVNGHCPWKQGVKTCESILIPDVSIAPGFEGYLDVFRRENISSVAFVPLVTDRGVIGKIMIYSDVAGGINAELLAMVESVARYAGAVIARITAIEAMRQSDHRTQLVIDTAMDALVAIDASGMVTAWNRQAERSFGYPAAHAVGRSFSELLLPSQQRPMFDGDIASFIRGDETRHIGRRAELQALRSDGATITIDMAMTAVNDRSARGGVWFSTFIRDVTESRRAEARLASSERRFRTLVEGANALVWEFDVASDTFTYVSPQAERLGYPTNRWYERGFWNSILHPDDAEQADRYCCEQIAAGLDHRYQYRVRTADGETVWIEDFVAVERSDDGSPTGTLRGVMVDVTDRKRDEQLIIEARAAADAANRTKSEFLANVSHEIRTPLTAILGYVDLLRDDGDLANAPSRRIETIDTIRSAGQHLLTVINDILDLSKIEAGKLQVENIETELPQLLCDVERLMTHRATGKGVEIRTIVMNAVPERVMSDPTRLRQILMNLLGNAVKFTERGHVSLTARVAESVGEGEPRLLVDIDDTGPGLSPDQAARLFEPFSQADTSVTRKHGGTGLGLVISRRLAQLLGGEVSLVRSVPGEGSCFRLDLPLKAAPGARMVDRIQGLDSAGNADGVNGPVRINARVLVLEDGTDNQRLIAYYLKKSGATYEVAENGRIGLDVFKRAQEAHQPFDLVLSDMQMPEMDGYTFARTLRSSGFDVPIIAMTAHAMSEDRAKCIDSGCDEYISKPIDWPRLLRMCRDLVEQPRGLRIHPGPMRLAG